MVAASETPPGTRWQPEWVVTLESGSEVGIVRDDHCFVVLTIDQDDQWHPVYHVPKAVAERMGQLVDTLARRG